MWVYFKGICFDEDCCLFSLSGVLQWLPACPCGEADCPPASRGSSAAQTVEHSSDPCLGGTAGPRRGCKTGQSGGQVCVCVFAWCNKRESREGEERERHVME